VDLPPSTLLFDMVGKCAFAKNWTTQNIQEISKIDLHLSMNMICSKLKQVVSTSEISMAKKMHM
jgi:hypothetical protein